MCTLTWVYAAQESHSKQSPKGSGYRIHFNRDESRQRSKAIPPKHLNTKNTDYLAPIDPQADGTWIFVNHWGFSACLLNNYIDIKGFIGSRSRGLLVRDMVDVQNIEQALTLVNNARIEQYAPFDLYLFDLSEVYTIGWNGQERTDIPNPTAFKSSSGFAPKEAISNREKYFKLSQESAQPLRNFHQSHEPEKSMLSVCMHRPDARTQSYTEITVSTTSTPSVSMSYTDGPPCCSMLSKPLSIGFKPTSLTE